MEMRMATWTVDPLHSDVQFKVKHLMINTVTGEFTSYNVNVDAAADDFSDAKIAFSADVNSINTKNEMRDGHLKSDDFFNAEKYPAMTFASTSFTKKADGNYSLLGDLTIRDVTKPVTLNVEYGGRMTDFYGNEKAGFEITGTINRKEFGLGWSAVTEAGGIVVSDDVRLMLNVQLQKTA
ncbi:MAG: YceI family protein [Candidatus Kapabacteria bacterium]|nr:YceI family protein [Candidatus Kapabacteria bacterium]